MSDALKIIDEILGSYGDRKASDIHLTSNRGAFYVKDKQTLPIPEFSHDGKALLKGMADSLPTLASIAKTGQGGASFDQGGKYRGRIAMRREQGGISSTIRIISRDIPTVAELGLPANVTNLIGRPSGLVLFVGQTGSGKSTTIASMVNQMNAGYATGIYTLESPIEYIYPRMKSLVIQREVGTHVHSFAEGIEDAKRSHPRIIVVGEILNVATARAALLAAASGHLVVSTMHAGTAAEAVDSFTSMYPPEEQSLVRTQLAQSLLGIIAQKLIPKDGGGLALAQEIGFNTRAFAELLRADGDRGNNTRLIQQLLLGDGTKDGMVAMESSLARLVKEGQISQESAFTHARDHGALNEKLTQYGVTPMTRAA